MSDSPQWFAPKRYGYGAVPVTWQGWALTIGFVILVTVLSIGFAKHPAQLIAAVIPPTIIFIVISARTTRGGWRWRWGEEE